jgi:CRP-like cAMP-binding protein
MADQDDLQILARAPLFSLLGRDALQLLSFAAERRSLATGEVLFRRGDRADGGYVVAEGALVLQRKPDSAGTFVAEPGALVGRAALFVRQNRPATATAREPSRVIRISPTLIRRVLEEYPAAAEALHRELAVELSALTGDLERVRRQLLAIDGVPDGGGGLERSGAVPNG